MNCAQFNNPGDYLPGNILSIMSTGERLKRRFSPFSELFEEDNIASYLIIA